MKPQQLSYNKSLSSEEGFLTFWFAMMTLGILAAGFTFLLYSEATISKMKANFIAMNLVITGSHNVEFDTLDPLNNMTMVVRSYGFRTATPVELVQTFSNGSVYYEAISTPGSNYGVRSVIEVNRSPLLSLLGYRTIETASYARSQQAPLYVDLAFDYSHSLSGGDIDQLLEGFDVTDGVGVAGVNGVVSGSEIIPTNTIQTLMPFAFDPTLGIALPWNEPSTIWPTVTTPADPSCIPGSEKECPTYSANAPTHEAVLRHKASDLFMSYKKTAALLAGVVGRLSPYTDVHIFGGVVPTDTVTAMTDNLGATFPAFTNDGVYEISLFDEDQYTNYSLDGSSKIIGDIRVDYNYDTPKDLIRDAISFAPDRILQIFLEMTFSRKLVRYGTLKDLAGVTLVNPQTYSELLDPPIPVLVDNPVSNDSFTYKPGTLTNGTYQNQLTDELFYKFGWPDRPSPLLSDYGAMHPANADIPLYIRYPWEYNCTTGIPLDIAARLNTGGPSIGRRLCLAHEQCSGGIDYNCDGSGGASLTLDMYRVYDDISTFYPNSNSPNCPAGHNPRCYPVGGGLQSANDGVICVNGTPRCHPDILKVPQCVNGFGLVVGILPSCCDMYSGTPGVCASWDPTLATPIPQTHTREPGSSVAPVLVTDSIPLGSTLGMPDFRGKIEFPVAEGASGYGNIFHYLMDLVPLQGGTWTNNVIPITRCQEFKDHFTGLDPECALIMVTDGRPSGIDADGAVLTSDADMMTDLTAKVDQFTGTGAGELNGKIFTWYLDHQPSEYEDLVDLLAAMKLAGTLDPWAVSIFDSYISVQATIPPGDIPVWDGSRPAGTPSGATYNAVTLPNYLADQSMLNDFETLMSTGSNLTWVETSLDNTASGPSIPASFFNGLEELLATLKKEVRFQK